MFEQRQQNSEIEAGIMGGDQLTIYMGFDMMPKLTKIRCIRYVVTSDAVNMAE